MATQYLIFELLMDENTEFKIYLCIYTNPVNSKFQYNRSITVWLGKMHGYIKCMLYSVPLNHDSPPFLQREYDWLYLGNLQDVLKGYCFIQGSPKAVNERSALLILIRTICVCLYIFYLGLKHIFSLACTCICVENYW